MRCRSGGGEDREAVREKGGTMLCGHDRDFSCSRGRQNKDTIRITMPLLELETCSKSLEGNPQCSSHGSVPDVQAMSHYAGCGASVCGPLRPMHFRKHRTMRKM